MFGFRKKISLDSSENKKLSEEDIQKKLYGTYKPGTLGKVYKADEVATTEASETSFEEPNLFSQAEESYSVRQAELTPEELNSGITASELSAAQQAKKEKDVSEEENILSESDEELLQLNLDKKESDLFNDENSKWESLKLTLFEWGDRIRSIKKKYLFISLAAIAGIVLLFSLVSTYVGIDEGIVPEEPISEEVLVENAPVVLEEPEVAVVPEVVAEPTPPVEAVVPATPEVQVTPAFFYSIQIAVSNDLDATNRLIADLEESNVEGFFREKVSRRGNTLYFIYGGTFPTESEASNALRAYKQMPVFGPYGDSYVTRLEPRS